MDTNTAAQAMVPQARNGGGKRERRMRSVDDKTRIVEESLAPGVSVAEVARRHGVNANLLFNWRRLHEQGVLGARTRAPKAAKLLPVKITEPDVTAERRPVPGMIEIEWPDKVRVRVAGGVSGEQLAAVFNALAQGR